MKLSPTFLAFGCLLLMGSLASAQEALPTNPESANLAAIFSASASSDCANAKLPSSEPALFGPASPCSGACSDAACAGQVTGHICGFRARCEHAFYVCSFEDCQCWSGPLP